MKPDVLVFYANQLIAQYTHDQWKVGSTGHTWTSETYNGAYLCFLTKRECKPFDADPGWYRKDLTPVLLEDVPKELLLLKLLMT